MDRKIFDKIVQAQEMIATDPEHQMLREEWERVNDQFLYQLSTMTREQQDAVMDDCGVLTELHLRTLKFILERKMEGESE